MSAVSNAVVCSWLGPTAITIGNRPLGYFGKISNIFNNSHHNSGSSFSAKFCFVMLIFTQTKFIRLLTCWQTEKKMVSSVEAELLQVFLPKGPTPATGVVRNTFPNPSNCQNQFFILVSTAKVICDSEHRPVKIVCLPVIEPQTSLFVQGSNPEVSS